MTRYFYLPIPVFAGRVLKCEGLATKENIRWMLTKHPDAIIVDGYRGDRIHADTLAAY